MGSSPSKLNEFAAPIFDPKINVTSLKWDDEKGTNPETIEGVLSNAEHKIANVSIAGNVAWYFQEFFSNNQRPEDKAQLHTSKRVYNILINGCLQKHCSADAVNELATKKESKGLVLFVGWCVNSVADAIHFAINDRNHEPIKDAQKLFGTAETVSAIQHVLANSVPNSLSQEQVGGLFRAVGSIVKGNEENKALFATPAFSSAMCNAFKHFGNGVQPIFHAAQAIGLICEGSEKRSAVFSSDSVLILALAESMKYASSSVYANGVVAGIRKMMESNSTEENTKMLENNSLFVTAFEKLGDVVDEYGKKDFDAVQKLFNSAS